MINRTPLVVLLCLMLSSCAYQHRSYYNPSVQDWESGSLSDQIQVKHTVFLLGDAGKAQEEQQDPVFKLLQRQLEEAGQNSTFVILGDNIYPSGMVDPEAPGRAEAERRLKAQLDLIENFAGKTVIIPGNHDWQQGGSQGMRYLKNQERFAEKYTGKKDIFLPENGCPGPISLSLNDELTLVLFDFQWWLHPHEKPEGLESDCEQKTEEDFLVDLDEMLNADAYKHLLVVAHHPLYSHGPHGGRFTFKDHFFPLTAAQKNLYLPLPIIGSIYPLYRSSLGNIQDIAHPKYQELRRELLQIFHDHPNLVYANGHEHALEYNTHDDLHFVVSGSGTKTSSVGHSQKTQFAAPVKGFSRLDYSANGEVWLSFWQPAGDGSEGKLLFRKRIYQKQVTPPVSQSTLLQQYANLDFSDSTLSLPGSQQYKAGKFKRFLFGKNYRDIWATPIEVPLFDIGKEKGGLRIVQRGGGMQTRSLRLEAADGRQYVLRSIEKYAEGAVPQTFRGTFAVNVVQDQISASHPYGALVVPQMAEAAGVMHTNPRLVFIPDDPRFGRQQEDFANTLALYEERPDDDWSDAEYFGNSKEIISTSKVLDALEDDNDNQVDQEAVVRSRLFDIVIGDWDRHDDQWRWASYKEGKGKVFRPIPRDRDQAFFRGEGPLMWIAYRKWAVPKFQPYDSVLRDVPGHTFNARFFDRTFLNGLSWESWERYVDTLQQQLSDDIIEQSLLASWPQPVYEKSGEISIKRIKGRRDRLRQLARDFYLFLAKDVDLVGSDKDEYIEIKRREGGDLEITISKWDEEDGPGKQLFHRIFLAEETREIKIYGRGGEDVFHFTGEGASAIRVRVIGGKDEDFVSETELKTRGIKPRIYDLKDGIRFSDKGRWADRTSKHFEVNAFSRKSYKYNVTAPAAFLGFNPDDGIFIGGGALIRTHGFRKDPYASQQLIVGNYAFKSNSFNFRYRGQFTDVIGKADLDLELTAFVPQFNGPWFGLGNETLIDPEQEIGFYWLNLSAVRFQPGIRFNVFKDHGDLTLAPIYQFVQADATRNFGRFIDNQALNGLDSAIFSQRYDPKHFAGGQATFEYKEINDRLYPTRGIHFLAEASHLVNLQENNSDFTRLRGELAMYFNINPLRGTLAARVGGAINLGEWDFFQGNSLGLLTGLRGFRKNRFMGQSAFFFNLELRSRIAYLNNPVLPTALGVLAFYDQGKVWMPGVESELWHRSLGGGIWLTPFDLVAVTLSYGVPISAEGPGDKGTFQLGLGFGF